jgi:SAM-dependent methyltransferase
MDYKEVNRGFYEAHAQVGEAEAQYKVLRERMSEDIGLFVDSLPGRDILDLGSGPGRDSLFFKQRGLNPLCFDFSPGMIGLCREKGLNAVVGDLENMPFSGSSFDGVWAYTSLLHMPKANLSPVLRRINGILRTGGVFYMGMKEGNFEGLTKSQKYPNEERYLSLFGDEELRDILDEQFDIAHQSKVPLGGEVFLNYLCRKIRYRI